MGARDDKGRFSKGNPGGPGRPRRTVEREYLDATLNSVSLEDWQAIVRKAVTDAKQGNAWARSWLGDYVLGKPPQILELRGGDVALLAKLLRELDARGVSASDVFNAMLQELVEARSSHGE